VSSALAGAQQTEPASLQSPLQLRDLGMSIIDDYRKSSDDRKAELLDEIEFEDVPEKWELLRAVISDTSDYDLARITALKILEIAAIPDEDLPAFCDLVISVIKPDKDEDVRNYAVIAAKNFVNDSDVLKQLIVDILQNPKEDIDVRHNALAAVRAFWDVPGRKVVLERLVSDKDMGKSAAQWLASLHPDAEK
jgi:hypothetical protein